MEAGAQVTHSTASLSSAVHALYDVHGGAQVQREASAWLENFGQTDDAWVACSAALGDAAGGGNGGVVVGQEVQFFAANMLLSKVRREWGVTAGKTATAMQNTAARALGAALEPLTRSAAAGDVASAGWRLVLQRVCLVLGAIASRSDRGTLLRTDLSLSLSLSLFLSFIHSIILSIRLQSALPDMSIALCIDTGLCLSVEMEQARWIPGTRTYKRDRNDVCVCVCVCSLPLSICVSID